MIRTTLAPLSAQNSKKCCLPYGHMHVTLTFTAVTANMLLKGLNISGVYTRSQGCNVLQSPVNCLNSVRIKVKAKGYVCAL